MSDDDDVAALLSSHDDVHVTSPLNNNHDVDMVEGDAIITRATTPLKGDSFLLSLLLWMGSPILTLSYWLLSTNMIVLYRFTLATCPSTSVPSHWHLHVLVVYPYSWPEFLDPFHRPTTTDESAFWYIAENGWNKLIIAAVAALVPKSGGR